MMGKSEIVLRNFYFLREKSILVSSNLLYFFVTILSVVVLLDPTNTIFGAKEILFLPVALLYLKCLKVPISSRLLMFLAFCCFIPSSFSLLRGILSIEIDLSFAISSIKNFSYSIMVLPLSMFDQKRLCKIMCVACLFLVVAHLVIWVSILCPNYALMGSLLDALSTEANNFTVRFGGSVPFLDFGMFYQSSPALLLFFAYLLFQNSSTGHLGAILVGFLLFLSGTQANQLSFVLIILFKLLSQMLFRYSTRRILFFYALLGVIVVLLLSPFLFAQDDESNSIKYGHFIGYIDSWDQNPLDFFIGSGLGSYFYSPGVSKPALVTELFWFELTRRHGIFIFMFFLAWAFYPTMYLLKYREDRGILIGYLAFLFTAGTNPLLIGSTGFFVITFVWAYSLRVNVERRSFL